MSFLSNSWMYNGSVSIGSPYQTSGMISYSTVSNLTLIPSTSCSTCANGGWFDESSSTTYTNLNKTQIVTVGVWAANCTMSTDDIQSWDASGDALTDFEFCLVTQSTDTEYPFDGVLGFGKPGTDD